MDKDEENINRNYSLKDAAVDVGAATSAALASGGSTALMWQAAAWGLGFGSAGIAKTTLAAGLMGPATVSGGLVATLQSVGAAGLAAAGAGTALVTVGVAAGVAPAAYMGYKYYPQINSQVITPTKIVVTNAASSAWNVTRDAYGNLTQTKRLQGSSTKSLGHIISMEFHSVGKHCSFPGCSQLGCKSIFCIEHRSFASHNCTQIFLRSVPECPICSTPIPVKSGEDPNRTIDEHISRGCPKAPSALNKCSFTKCQSKEVVPIVCELCLHNHCFRHRHPEDHQCSAVEKKREETKKKHSEEVGVQVVKRVDQIIAERSKTNPTARKVQTMKMKTKAVGNNNVPPENRFYLEVIYPINSGVEPKMFFFNPEWSIGKADSGKITNNNNQANADKLHIVSLKSGQPLPNSLSLKDVEEVLTSGDAVLLERESSLK
ncbi:zinc finger, AN1 type domain 2B [Planoprotostelium fungivorum]|uniref:Zinc finger, AN1 type domain 2B n=1 Tax=Planoprotostelium fungivorum TaxID=1890364 RepID=A0A2P6NS41_9EUKA|nr:zinc finger, AN1 type domain 2B [Planoprotostelium fungivorum]